MGAHLEMLAAVLVFVWRADDAVHVLLCGQRYWARDSRPGAFDGFHDLLRGRVNHLMVVCLEPDADLLSGHLFSFFGSY